MIEKVDDRNAERIMRTEILDRFVKKSLPTGVPVISYIGQFTLIGWRNSDIFVLDFHGTIGSCYKARVTSVEYNKVPEKAYVFTFAELGSF